MAYLPFRQFSRKDSMRWSFGNVTFIKALSSLRNILLPLTSEMSQSLAYVTGCVILLCLSIAVAAVYLLCLFEYLRPN